MYEELDNRILDAVNRRQNPLYDRFVSSEANRIAVATERQAFRVTDGRLQTLRRQKRIQWMTNAQAPDGRGGWRLFQPDDRTAER